MPCMPEAALSPHFHLSEFLTSGTAARLGIPNVPNKQQLANLGRLVLLLENVRAILGGVPILISSGFRAPQLNAAVGGAANSAHLDGRAADFIAPRAGTPKEICERLAASSLMFDQLIYEGTWVHLGIAAEGVPVRRQVLTASFERYMPTKYLRGVV